METLKKGSRFRWRHSLGVMRVGICALGMMAILALQNPDDSSSRESQVKAVFLYNFTQFVVWPESSFPATESPFVIGILGKDAIGKYLNETIKNETVNGHPIQLRYYTALTPEISQCHMLFVDKTFDEKARAIEATNGKAILTVSDDKDFMKLSGMFRFFLENGKIRFEVNPDISGQSGLQISSKLLRLAKIYERKG